MPSRRDIKFFFRNREKIVAIFVLFIFVWTIFSVFVLFNRNKQVLSQVDPVPFGYSVTGDKRSARSAEPAIITVTTSSRPVAVMIDNYVTARPQAGISQAERIYETLVEGGATRFMAVFNAFRNVEKIGPVRSARPYFVVWASEYDALYVHAGGSPEALTDINNWQIHDMNEISGYGTTYFYRDNSLAAPHNLFTDSDRLSAALQAWNLTDMTTTTIGQPGDLPDGSSAHELHIDFSEGEGYDARFRYATDTALYVRLNGNRDWVDADSGEALAAANIIVQKIPVEELSGGQGRLALDVSGNGDGLLFQRGLVQDINWRKIERTTPTSFTYADGTEVRLLPGLTWIIVVPGEREIAYE